VYLLYYDDKYYIDLLGIIVKLGRLIIDIDDIELSNDDIELLKHPYVGGVILFSRNFHSIEQVTLLIDDIKKIRSPSLIVYVDQEGDRVQRFKKGFTALPSIELLEKKYIDDDYSSLELSKNLGWLISYELRRVGVDVNTMPVLDINYERSNVMSRRCFAKSHKIVSELAEYFIKGAKEIGIASICKHYPGHGYAKTDSHVELPEDNRDFKTIYGNDIAPYKMAIDKDIEGIMTSHVLYKYIDSYPPTISLKWLQILKNDLRYKGLIFSDDLSMKALEKFGSIDQNLTKAINAGCDCIFICNNREKVVDIIDNVYLEQSEEISNKIVKLSKKRIQNNIDYDKNRSKILGQLQKIEEKKQIEINI